MSEINEEQQEQEVQQAQDLPGKRLREAREAAGLSREEVAADMRLNERMVKALEEDDYSVFPSATFVSGYLRSYARILGLPEEDYVKPIKESIEPPSLVSTVGSKAQVSSSDLPVKMVTYLLVIVVIASVSMWWLSQREKTPAQPMEAANEVMQGDGDVNLSLPEKDKGEETAMAVADEAESADSVAATEQDKQDMPADGAEASTEETSPAQPEQDASMDSETQPVAESDAAGQEQQASPPPITADTPTSKLELRYQADSWTEVTDNAGRRLIYGLIKAGQDLTVKGEAPFRVFLGYAPGVMVYYNNDLFDHSPFQRRDVARFRVGRAEHNLPGSR